MQPAVSVVISLYNKARYIERSVGSVLSQTFRDFELLVVDDGSTDDGPRLAAGMRDPRIRIIRQANSGVSAARNRGAQEAAAPLVAYLDADDEYKPELLAWAVERFREKPELGTVAFNYEVADLGKPRRSAIMPAEPSMLLGIGEYCRLGRYASAIFSSAVMAKKELLRRIGGFPQEVRAGEGEDLDTWLRLIEAGPVFFDARVAAVYHRDAEVHASRTTPPPKVPCFFETLDRVVRNTPGLTPAELRHAAEVKNYFLVSYAVRQIRFHSAAEGRSTLLACDTRVYRRQKWTWILISLLPGRLAAWLRRLKRAPRSMRMKAAVPWLLRLAAIAALAAVYGAVALLSRGRNGRGRDARRRSGCILAIGTFYNPNWIRSHIRPLARSGIGEVILVCDEAVRAMMAQPMDKARCECPPRWMALLLSRAVAKFIWTVRCAFRYRPDLYMGYHIFPGAVTALVAARLFNRPACYQDTSGPLELEGGGWHAENPLLAALQRPSPLVERLASGVVHEFDSVVVRGKGAEAYIRQIGYRGSLAVITGSVEPAGAWRDFAERRIDLTFVGRLTEYKKPERFLAVVAAVARALPRVRAVLAGDGPDAESLKALACRLGIEANVEFLGKRADVDDLLAVSRAFVLTSRWEGVSIAMLEAMAAGAVPVVANVGDLADLVRDEVTGFIVAPDDIAGYARGATRLLTDEDLWRRCSGRAVAAALESSGIDAVAQRWGRHLGGVIAKPREASAVAYGPAARD